MEDEANISSTQAEDSTKVFWGVSPFGGKANGSIQSPLSRKRMISGSNIQNSKDESPVNPKLCGKKYKNKLSLRMEEGEENGLLKNIKGIHELAVVSVKFSPNGQFLASASSDKSIIIWRCNQSDPSSFSSSFSYSSSSSWSRAFTIKGHHLQGINDIAWSFHSKWLCSASDDSTVLLWDIESLLSEMSIDNENDENVGNGGIAPARSFKGHSSYVFCVNFNPASSLIVSGSYDESIKLWDVFNGTCHRTIPAHSDPVSGVNFSPDGSLIVSASFDGLIRIWDSYSGQCLKTLVDNNTHAPISFVDFSPNGKYLLTCSLDNTIRLWSYMGTTDQVVRQYKGHKSEKYCTFARFAPPITPSSDSLLISGSEDGFVYIWSVESQKLLTKVQVSLGPVAGLDLWLGSKDQPMLAIGTLNPENAIKIFDLKDVICSKSNTTCEQ